MKILKNKKYSLFLLIFFVFAYGCNYVTYRTVTKEQLEAEDDPEPVYDITLNPDYQDYITYMFMGNRSEEFGTFFNKFYQALEDYDEAMTDYRASTITTYNRRLDSLNVTPPISVTAKDKLTKVLERCSKIIQYNKSTRFIDDAVLLIGKSYFYMGEYMQAERKFSEFLSKLTKSDLYDEAILYLGKTELKLGKNADAEVILSNLFKTTTDNEIKSEITQELAILSITKNNYQDAIDYFVNSIDLTKDKEKKAEKQYILAKVYSKFKPAEAYIEYRKSYDLTSDFDLLFYSKLNEAKSLNVNGKTNDAYEILDRLNGKYRDYPELKQLVELEIANTLYYQKKYEEAKIKYFDVIIDYAASKTAADAYYHLARYSEYVKDNYLYAYVNYKKVNETNSNSDYADISLKRTSVLDKYFALVAIINDTTKIVYPDNEPDFIKHKELREKEKGDEYKEHQNKGNENLNQNQNPKGGGFSGTAYLLDTIGSDNGGELNDSTETTKPVIKDTNIVNIPGDTTVKVTEPIVKKLSPEDSLLLAMHIEDSIKTVKQLNKIDAYFQLSELFLYDLNRVDSALYYLDIIISDSINPERTSKALYTVATIYKNQNEDSKAKELLERIVTQYPNTLFANEARKVLGLPLVEISIDSADVIYKSAARKIMNNEYESAMTDLKRVLGYYPTDSIYIKTLYSIGWLFEYAYNNKDSSLAYYEKIKKDYPNSQYAISINPKLDFYESLNKSGVLDSNGVLSDSLKSILDTSGVLKNIENLKQDKQKEEGKNPPTNENQDLNGGEGPPVINQPEEKKK